MSVLRLTNVADKEIVHQRCLLVTGTCDDDKAATPKEVFVAVSIQDAFSKASDPQNWPVAARYKSYDFRCLLMLQPGPNIADFRLFHQGRVCATTKITLNYQPLLQLPPLHLAIMVAKDSPLMIDCPPVKRGAFTSAHSTLDAAVSKLRMTAYMWQALLAEEFRSLKLRRRTFRLEEQWETDTTTFSHLQCDSGETIAGSVAKVHIVRSDKTVAELRDPQVAQQNHHSRHRTSLYQYFEQALRSHGAPFTSRTRPVVAGLVLDSHFSVSQSLIVAHAAMGQTKPTGLSLGMFGSHLTCSWPRFLEEIPACLMDANPTGDTFANDHGRCPTLQAACSYGQGSFLTQVAQAFGASRDTDFVYGKKVDEWRQRFIDISSSPASRFAGLSLRDALKLSMMDHFRVPLDERVTPSERESPVSVRCVLDSKYNRFLEAKCLAGIALVRFKDRKGQITEQFDYYYLDASADSIQPPAVHQIVIDEEGLEKTHDNRKKRGLEVIGMNGNIYTISNVWPLLADQPFVKVPGTSLVLSKRSVKAREAGLKHGLCRWATLLKRKYGDGNATRLAYANRIDLRVGVIMDGVVVYFSDGTKCNCGPANQTPLGGHQARDRTLSQGESLDIRQVSIASNRSGWGGGLIGCRVTLASGAAWGAINAPKEHVQHLMAQPDERIIGFYGRSDISNGFTVEFGIITAPKSVVDGEDGLPRQIYDMPELQNVNDPGSDDEDDEDDEDHDDEDEGDEDEDMDN
ncbi:metallopeptidase [Apiospora rasikravindrae]|uniref:Metallopeptidase n=1 Tax=Apiospora rasikravindrae TaxID=990691 RepID=A0ABR1TCP6_9PEZI